MLFVIRFTDLAAKQAVRREHLQAHIKWLDRRRDSILVAGSLRNNVKEDPLGALWIVEAESKASLPKLFESDPFWVHGLRESFEIMHWSKAFPDEKTPI